MGAPAMQPKEQRSLGGIAYHLRLLSRQVKLRGGVDRDALVEHLVGRVAEEIGAVYLHLVLRQRTGFVQAKHIHVRQIFQGATLLSGSAPAHTKVPSPILVIPSSTTILLIKPL